MDGWLNHPLQCNPNKSFCQCFFTVTLVFEILPLMMFKNTRTDITSCQSFILVGTYLHLFYSFLFQVGFPQLDHKTRKLFKNAISAVSVTCGVICSTVFHTVGILHLSPLSSIRCLIQFYLIFLIYSVLPW